MVCSRMAWQLAVVVDLVTADGTMRREDVGTLLLFLSQLVLTLILILRCVFVRCLFRRLFQLYHKLFYSSIPIPSDRYK